MPSIRQSIRSSTASKRPTSAIADGQIALNTASGTPGIFFKDSAGNIVKAGPAHYGATAPNSSPAVGGSTGNSFGEAWLDVSLTPAGWKIWNGSAWVNATPLSSDTVQGLVELATNAETQAGVDAARAVTAASLQSKVSDSISTTSASGIASSTAVKTAYDLANAALPKSGGIVTGNLEIGSTGSFTFEGATADGFETTLAVVDPTADRTITFPNITGTVVTTGDTGTVTSTMILDGTILDADINASAAIVDTKLATIATALKVSNSATTATDANTPSAIVARSASGNFTAGTITAALTGAASSNVLKAGDTMTGVLAVTAGTAALPGIAVSGDLNTGIYSPGADQVAISTSGTGRLFVDASGNVSLNRAAPATLGANYTTFTIRGKDNDFGGGIIFESLDASDRTFLYGDSGAFYVATQDARPIVFGTNGTEKARLTSAGLLGIGTSAPQAELNVAKAGGASTVYIESDAGNNATTSILRFGGASGRSASIQGFRGASSNIHSLDFYTYNSADVFGMRLTSTGLGIGNTAPSLTLDIKAATDGLLRVGNSGETSHGSHDARIVAGGTYYQNPIIVGSAIKFNTYNGSAEGERMRLTAAGLLGLGTSSPITQLNNTGTTSLGTVNWPTTDLGNTSGRVLIGNEGVLAVRNETVGAGSGASIYLGATTGVSSTTFGNSRIDGGTENATNRASFFKILTSNTVGTPSTALYIDSSQRVGIGSTTPSATLDVQAASARSKLVSTTGTNAAYHTFINTGGNFYIGLDNSAGTDFNAPYAGAIWHGGAYPIIFGTSNAQRAAIDSSGRLLVGTSSSTANARAVIQGRTASATDQGVLYIQRGSSGPGVVSDGSGIGEIWFADSNGFAAANIMCLADNAWGGGGNDYPGRLVFSTTADGAASPTERMRITAGGSLLHGITNPGTDTYLFVRTTTNTVALFDRSTNDGTLLQFRQGDVDEGSISVSGTTVSYNGAHLSRWSQLLSGATREEILRGTVLSNIDEMCNWGEEDNEQLNRMKVSDIEGDKNVSGVFQCWDDDDDTYTNDFYCAMTGDFIIRIAEGVVIERGDLLMSAGDGTAKPQDDDIIRSKTIAKVTSTHVTCTYEDGSYCVPCVLMAC